MTDPSIGLGYGTEAMLWACDYVFNVLGLHRIELRATSDNHIARKCYKKCGFIEEGSHRKTHLVDGVWKDTIVLGMLEEDWACR